MTVFTPARIVALTIIGLAALGLLYLRFGLDDDPVSVPNGAVAGDCSSSAATTRPKTAPTPRTAGRSSCPRIGPTRSRG